MLLQRVLEPKKEILSPTRISDWNAILLAQIEMHDVYGARETIRFCRGGVWFEEPTKRHPSFLVCTCYEAERLRKAVNERWESPIHKGTAA